MTAPLNLVSDVIVASVIETTRLAAVSILKAVEANVYH